MIHINLDGVHRNNWSDTFAELLVMHRKLEALAYADNPHEMDAGVPRCFYVRRRMEGLHYDAKDSVWLPEGIRNP